MTSFKAVLIEKSDAGQKARFGEFDEADLMDGDVTVLIEQPSPPAKMDSPSPDAHLTDSFPIRSVAATAGASRKPNDARPRAGSRNHFAQTGSE